ncbi:hypothetical protein RI367_001799 [Sorochytrium milnesiophthora]
MLPAHPSTAATPAPNSRSQSKYHPVAIYHSHFSKHQEKEASAVLHKHVLLANGKGLLGDYRPDKIVTRTAASIKSRDSKALALEKAKRREQVMLTGFNSDIKEPYKPLGAPVLDSEELLVNALQLDMKTAAVSSQKPLTGNAATVNTRQSAIQSMKESQQRLRKGAPTTAVDDYDKLRHKLVVSKNRLHAVKFGVPLALTMTQQQIQEAERLQKEANERVGMALFGEEGFDWNPDKIDREKMNYYLRVMDIDAKSNGEIKVAEDMPSTPSSALPASIVLGSAAVEAPHAAQERLATSQQQQAAKQYDVEQLELLLQIKRPSVANPEHTLHKIRESFTKERQRMAEELSEELSRVDRQRNSIFVQKYRAFNIGVNGICSTDMENMRRKAASQRLTEKTRLLHQHPWYGDLINKVVYGNGTKKELTPSEHKLLKRVRSIAHSLIGDHVPFDKVEFAKLMKLVPPHDFMKDEVQRILKFLKQNCGLSELDFLDAIESSGQMLVAAAEEGDS